MAELKMCKTCGVPLRIGRGHIWNEDGTITQRRDRDHRMVFVESDGLDALFSNITTLIGMPIEKMVIEAKARATMAYISALVRGTKGQLARVIGLQRIITTVVEQGKVMGYGNIKVTEYNWKESRMTCEIENPYSLPMFCGDLKGANQAIRKVAGTVSTEQIGPDKYRIKNFNAPHAPELEERLFPAPPPRKPGDMTYDRCPSCRAPREIARYRWDLDQGTIINQDTGLRMAMFGPNGLQAIFDELEDELGEDIPATIVEAQRMHMATLSDDSWQGLRQADFRNWLSVQGLGDLVSMTPEGEGYTAVIQNAALPLVIVGTSLALFEYVSEGKGNAVWKVGDDGDLTVTVRKE